MEDVGRAFTYMFRDDRWVTKLLIGGAFVILAAIISGIWSSIANPAQGTAAGGVLSIIGGLINLAASSFYVGYAIETLQNVAAGRETPLPEWTDLGRKFTLGVILGIALFVYQLPASILGLLAGGLFIAGVGGGGAPGVVAVGTSAGLALLAGLVGLLVAFLIPAIIISYAHTPTFSGAFNFRRIFGIIGANFGAYLIVIVLIIVAFLLSLLGLIGLIIGVFFTFFWAFLVVANLLGQLWRDAERKGVA